eukprot:scaffold8772_cov112-Skeletonema_marinoi.AAC.4
MESITRSIARSLPRSRSVLNRNWGFGDDANSLNLKLVKSVEGSRDTFALDRAILGGQAASYSEANQRKHTVRAKYANVINSNR